MNLSKSNNLTIFLLFYRDQIDFYLKRTFLGPEYNFVCRTLMQTFNDISQRYNFHFYYGQKIEGLYSLLNNLRLLINKYCLLK